MRKLTYFETGQSIPILNYSSPVQYYGLYQYYNEVRAVVAREIWIWSAGTVLLDETI